MRQSLRNKIDEKPIKRVALYLRSSSLAQVNDGYGLESQERILKSYVEANSYQGWTTNENLIYREDSGIPGNVPPSERPELSRLMADIEAGKIDIVAVWKLDRIFRKTALMLNFVDFLVEKEVVFVSRLENIDMSTEVGRMVLTIFAAMAEVERSTIAARTREGKISKAKDGYIVYGSVVPYGYRKVEAGKGYKLGIDQEEAEIVREIFSMYVDDGYGTGEIARILTARGIGTNIDRRKKSGEAIPHEKIHQNLFRQDTVRRILQNTVYAGEYVCNKYESIQKDGKTLQRLKDESEWVVVPCEEIVDRDIFLRAQDLLEKTHVLRGRGEKHIFTGLIKCGECGRSLNYYKSHKGTGQYRCGGKKRDKVSKENLCTNRDISEAKMMEVVWPQIENFLSHPKEFLKHYEQLLQDDGTAKRKKETEIKYARTVAEIAEKKAHHKNALRREMEGGDNAEAFASIAADYLEEIKSLEVLRNTLTSDLKTYEKREEAMNAVLERSNEYRGKLAQITEEKKGELIREFVYQIELSRLNGVVEFMFEKV